MSVTTYIRLTIIEREHIRAGEIAVHLDLSGITFPTCLEYVLEKTANMSPTLMPERGGGSWQNSVDETADADGDDQFLLGDPICIHPRMKPGTMKGIQVTIVPQTNYLDYLLTD